MIIQLRGTSGSGKTTVMRSIKHWYAPVWNPIYREGRKQPEYYLKDNAVILGHYEATCGGCDNIGSARAVYELIHGIARPDIHVILCEGLLLSEDTKWTIQNKHMNTQVIFLTTPIETCLERVKQRRRQAGNEKPLNEKNTINRVATIERARRKLIDNGVKCYRASVDLATKLAIGLITNRHSPIGE